MSTPRGNRVQRELIAEARALLEPVGCTVSVDFSTRHGHQMLDVIFPGCPGAVRFHVPSSPRNGADQAWMVLRARIRRTARDKGVRL